MTTGGHERVLYCIEGGAGTCLNADLIDALLQRIAELEAALEAVEWVAINSAHWAECAWCDEPYPNHANNCQRQAALRVVRREETE